MRGRFRRPLRSGYGDNDNVKLATEIAHSAKRADLYTGGLHDAQISDVRTTEDPRVDWNRKIFACEGDSAIWFPFDTFRFEYDEITDEDIVVFVKGGLELWVFGKSFTVR